LAEAGLPPPPGLALARALELVRALARVEDLAYAGRLVRDLSALLHARIVLVLAASGPGDATMLLACWPDVPCLGSVLGESPLVARLKRGEEVLARQASPTLAEDPLMRRLDAQGVLAVPLGTAEDPVRGGLLVIPGPDTPADAATISFLRVCAAQATAALLRLQDEALARAVLEQTGDGIGITHPDGRLLLANPALVRATGRSLEELVGLRLHDLVSHELQGTVDRLLQGQEAGPRQVKLLRSTGEATPAEITAFPLEVTSRPMVLCTLRDLSERLAAEEALRASEAQYRGIFEAVTDGLIILDAAGEVVEANPAACAMHGYSREEFLALEPREYIHPDHHWQFEEFLRSLQAGRSFHVRALDLRRDGTPFEVEVRGTRFPYKGRLHLLAVLRDVSLERQMEKERSALERQLRQTQKMEALGQLASGIAHDFNNLLTAILGHVDLANDALVGREEAPPDLQEALGMVRQAAERATDLTRQLLVFGRGRQEGTRAVDVPRAVAELERMLQRLIGENIHLETSLASDSGWIEAVPGQLEQAILNMVLNARDAMPGGGRLYIRTEAWRLPIPGSRSPLPSGRYCRILVEDDGQGMDARTRERIFEPFFTTKAPGQGSGLGMTMVYAFVQACGGHVEVWSKPGHGTRIELLLPASEHAEVLEESRADVPVPGGDETILLVEDQDLVRDLTRQVLATRGYRVLAAANAIGAQEVLQGHQGPVDLAVVDLILPGMNGAALARALRRERPELQVLFISGYSAEVLDRVGEDLGPGDLLPKPFRAAELLAAVRRKLDRNP